MTAKASNHIKPCNIAQSERHNRRDTDYIKSLNPKRLYIRTDLTDRNETYVAPGMEGVSLQQHYDNIRTMVKEKTGRAMQEKDVEFTDKKGKKRVRQGCSPIRESVVNIKPGTMMNELMMYAERVHERWGIRAIQIHIHRDEGHYENPDVPTTWEPNLHAHIIWDWMDHSTGKSYKLNADDMSVMQDMVAETLGMERGQKKAETGIEHLERNDFIIQKQENKKKQLQNTLDTLETYAKAADVEEEDLIVPQLKTNPLVMKAEEAIQVELDKPIPTFSGQKQWKEERKKAVKEILTDLQTELMQAKEMQKQDIQRLGKSLYQKARKDTHAIIEENKRLRKSNERLTAENTGLKEKISTIDETAISNLRKQKDEEIKELQIECDRANAHATKSDNIAVREHQRADHAEKQLREMLAVPEIKEKWDSIQRNMKAFWLQIDEWITSAIKAIRDFACDYEHHDFPQEQGQIVGMGIIAEAFKHNLDATDDKQRMEATHSLLGKVSWTGITPFMSDLTKTRTKQLSEEMNVPKELMERLFLAAGGRGSVGTGGGGSDNELTNWDGTKKRNGWGI